MPVTKTGLFELKDVRIAALAKAIAHPARIAILKALAKRDECICGEIVDVLPLAQSTVSQHLKELKKIGLIKGEVDGPRSCYCIDKESLREYSEAITMFLGDIRTNRSKQRRRQSRGGGSTGTLKTPRRSRERQTKRQERFGIRSGQG